MRRLKFFGHPLHPATVHFPLGLLVGATAVDVLGWLWPAIDGDAARLMLILGLVAAAPTVATGFLDFLAIAREPAVERTAVYHLLSVSVALAFYGASLWLRQAAASGAIARWTSLGGALALLGAGWFGGQLVYRHGEGVEATRRNL